MKKQAPRMLTLVLVCISEEDQESIMTSNNYMKRGVTHANSFHSFWRSVSKLFLIALTSKDPAIAGKERPHQELEKPEYLPVLVK